MTLLRGKEMVYNGFESRIFPLQKSTNSVSGTRKIRTPNLIRKTKLTRALTRLLYYYVYINIFHLKQKYQEEDSN